MKKFAFLFAVLILAGVGCRGGQTDTLAVTLNAPTNVNLGESFQITVNVENRGDEARILDSVDIDAAYLDGVVIESSNPSYSETFYIPVDNTISHTFLTDIDAGETLTLTFEAVAYAPGLFVGDFDVCIDTGYTCQNLSISTNVVGDEEFDLSLDLDDYELVVEEPQSVLSGDLVEVRALITNNKPTDAVLDSIDIGEEYLSGIELSSAAPPFTDFYLLETDNTRSHTFDHTIPSGETLEVIFYGTAVAAGEYMGAFDVCMDVGYNCWFETVQTVVE